MGYICVFQNCRGRFESQGEWKPFVHEKSDGLDTLNWIISQKWCNGYIGMTGESYLSMVQWILADSLPPQVKTLNFEVFNPYRNIQMYSNNMFKLEAYTGWTVFNSSRNKNIDDKKNLYFSALNYKPQCEMDINVLQKSLPWYRNWISHPDNNDEYWDKGIWKELKDMPSKINIPVLMRAGWYDPHLQGMLNSYNNLTDEIKRNSILMITPFNHIGKISSDDDIGDAYSFIGKNFIRTKLMWFDYNLKCYELNRSLKKGSIYSYRIGEKKWIEYSKPDNSQSTLDMFLDFSDNSLIFNEPKNDSFKTFIYDPNALVKTCGSDVLMCEYIYLKEMKSSHGRRLQPKPDYREDVLTLISNPLDTDLNIFGSIKIKLFVKSSCKDTSFTAKISEITENGDAFHIRDNITTLNLDKQYIPENIKEINIDLWEIDIKIKKGRRLRLDISSSNFPAFHIHPNTETLWSQENEYKTANQTVYSGNKYLSKIILPVLNQEN